MTKNLNVVIALLGLWCYQPTEALAQTQATTMTALGGPTMSLHIGQPFPYPLGVGIELSTYHRIRERLTLADLVIESKNHLNDSLAALLASERSLRQLDQLTLVHIEREYAKQTVNYQQLAASCERTITVDDKSTPQRAFLKQRGFWLGVGLGLFVATIKIKGK